MIFGFKGVYHCLTLFDIVCQSAEMSSTTTTESSKAGVSPDTTEAILKLLNIRYGHCHQLTLKKALCQQHLAKDDVKLNQTIFDGYVRSVLAGDLGPLSLMAPLLLCKQKHHSDVNQQNLVNEWKKKLPTSKSPANVSQVQSRNTINETPQQMPQTPQTPKQSKRPSKSHSSIITGMETSLPSDPVCPQFKAVVEDVLEKALERQSPGNVYNTFNFSFSSLPATPSSVDSSSSQSSSRRDSFISTPATSVTSTPATSRPSTPTKFRSAAFDAFSSPSPSPRTLRSSAVSEPITAAPSAPSSQANHCFAVFSPRKDVRKINESVKTLISRRLLPSEIPQKDDSSSLKKGTVYLYTFPEHYRAQNPPIKIGNTNNIDRRMNQWRRQCGYEPEHIAQYSSDLYIKAERLIHKHLANDRLVEPECAKCACKHTEWFQCTVLQAHKIAGLWTEWGRRQPYTEAGELKVEWAKRLEKLDMDDPNCWKKFVQCMD